MIERIPLVLRKMRCANKEAFEYSLMLGSMELHTIWHYEDDQKALAKLLDKFINKYKDIY